MTGRLLETAEGNAVLDQFPPECPRCSRLIAAMSLGIANDLTGELVEAVFQCRHCRGYFIGRYESRRNNSWIYLQCVLPRTPVGHTFPDIESISARFSEIFNQASAAESYGLPDIAGTGYRKALEFLVKDYCIALHPDKVPEIRKAFLKNVINTYVDDGKLKRAATLTTWLGNDEGHYERRWVDKDLRDLKSLLHLTVGFVDEEIRLERYLRSMDPNQASRITFLPTASPDTEIAEEFQQLGVRPPLYPPY